MVGDIPSRGLRGVLGMGFGQLASVLDQRISSMTPVAQSAEASIMLRGLGYSASIAPPDVSQLPLRAFQFSQDDSGEYGDSINYDQMIDSVMEELALFTQKNAEIQMENHEANLWNKSRWALVNGKGQNTRISLPIPGFSFTKPAEIHGTSLVHFLQKWRNGGRFSKFAGLIEEMNKRRWNSQNTHDMAEWYPLLELSNFSEISYEQDESFASLVSHHKFFSNISSLHRMLHAIVAADPETLHSLGFDQNEEQQNDSLVRGALGYLRAQFRLALEDERRQEQERRRREECVQKLAFEEGDPLEACELVFRHARRLALHGPAHDFHYDCQMFTLPRRSSFASAGGMCSGDAASPSYHSVRSRGSVSAAAATEATAGGDGVPTWAMTLLMLRHGADRSDPFSLFRVIHPFHESLDVTLVTLRGGGAGGGLFRCGFRRADEAGGAATAGGGSGAVGGGRGDHSGPALREMVAGGAQRFEFPADGPGVTGLVCELLPLPGSAGGGVAGGGNRLSGSLPVAKFGPCRATGWEQELTVRLGGSGGAAAAEAVLRIRYAEPAGGGTFTDRANKALTLALGQWAAGECAAADGPDSPRPPPLHRLVYWPELHGPEAAFRALAEDLAALGLPVAGAGAAGAASGVGARPGQVLAAVVVVVVVGFGLGELVRDRLEAALGQRACYQTRRMIDNLR